ncbi:hypothetical protein ACWEJ6_51485 [Nonomuraea sp. NPDC004702]
MLIDRSATVMPSGRGPARIQWLGEWAVMMCDGWAVALVVMSSFPR